MVRKQFPLLALPYELIVSVLSNLDLRTLMSIRTVCKTLNGVLDPKTEHGALLWRQFRRENGFPEPSVIGITDYQFCLAFFGRGCNFCNLHPKIRKPYWEFQGLRMCPNCFSKQTIRSYQLSNDQLEWCSELPYIYVEGYSRSTYSGSFEYRVYLRADIPTEAPTQAELEEHRNRTNGVDELKTLLARREDAIARIKLIKDGKSQSQRRDELRSLFNERFLGLHPTVFKYMKCVNSAWEKSTKFTKSARTRLLSDIEKEFQQNKRSIIRDHIDACIQDVIRTTKPDIERILYYVHRYENIDLQSLPSHQQIVAISERAQRRARWGKLCDDVNVFEELSNTAIFRSANADSDQEVTELINSLTTKWKLRKSWMRLCGNVQSLLYRLFETAYYTSPKLEDDDFVRNMIQQWIIDYNNSKYKDLQPEVKKLIDEGYSGRPFGCKNCRFCMSKGADFDTILNHVQTGFHCKSMSNIALKSNR